MKPLIALLAVSLQLAHAEELLIGDPDWGARMTLPQQWENDNYMGTWYQGWTKDRTVWVSAITFARLPADWHRKWLPKHCDTFGVDVTVPAEIPKALERRVGTFKATEYPIAATWEEAPAEISVITVELAPNRMFLLTVGGRAADRLLHKEVIEKIISSIRVEPGKKPNPKTDTIKAQQDAP